MTTGLVPGDEHMNTQPSRTRQLQDGSMAMQISDRRVAPRFRVQFRTFLTDQHSMSEHMGTILDLSVIGCRVESLVPVEQSAVMELRIYVPDLDWPLMVDEAVVQWVKGNSFGLYFVKARPGTQDRLSWVLTRLAEEGHR
jgi:hypothetical protein